TTPGDGDGNSGTTPGDGDGGSGTTPGDGDTSNNEEQTFAQGYRIFMPLIMRGTGQMQQMLPSQETPATFGMLASTRRSESLHHMFTSIPGLSPQAFNGFRINTLVSAARQHGRDNTSPFGHTLPGFNGALFIDCMLRAANFAPARCNGTTADQSYIAMNALRVALLNAGAVPVPENQVVPGDILFLNYAGTTDYCWGGVTVEVRENPREVRVATQSVNFENERAEILQCRLSNGTLVTPGRSYLRLDSEAPFANFIQPALESAQALTPGRHVVSYSAEDPALPTVPASGVQGFSVAYTRDGQATLLANQSAETTLVADLDVPCRAVDLGVVAFDRSGNASLERAGWLDAFVLLRGDADGDGQITEADYELIRAAEGLTAADPGFHPGLDPTGDGMVDAADRLFVEALLLNTCPQP
ncbi:hypothetical protein, partial [Candidatus Viridilinea mediisalina]